jgi:hypothetical protein
MSYQPYLFSFSNKTTNKTTFNANNSPLKLYYYLYDDNEGTILNSSETLFVTDDLSNDTYRGITNRFMSNSDYTSYTSDIISYISSRTPKSTEPGVFDLDMYNEILTINSPPYQDNYIQAVCNYEDTSSGYATTVDFNNFVVTASSGKFKNYKNIKITYSNTGKYTRELEFS